MASIFCSSVASSLNSRIAPRALLRACLASLLVSFFSALSISGSIASSWVLNTDCAASMRLSLSGEDSVRPPSAASTARRRWLLIRTRRGAIGNAGDRGAGRGIDDLAVGLGDVNLLGVGIGHQATVLQRADDRKGQRIARGRDHADGFLGRGIIVVGEIADRVLERPGERPGTARWSAARERQATRKARESQMSPDTFLNLGGGKAGGEATACRFQSAERDTAVQGSRPPSLAPAAFTSDQRIRNPNRRTCWSWCCSCRTSCQPNRRSGPWNQAVPSTRRRRQSRPGDLPHHVELAIGLDLADEHRLGDVVVRQHLGHAAGQVRRLGARAARRSPCRRRSTWPFRPPLPR